MANFVSYSDMTALMTVIGNKFSALNGAYVIKGNSTFANLPSTPTAAQEGFVYNVTDDFTTDSRFVEGSGKSYPAGTNVVIVNLGDATTPNMKYDVIGAFVDLSNIDQALVDLQVSIADPFDVATSYTAGEVVTYGHKLYAFKVAHAAGAWDAEDVDEVTVEDLIDNAVGDVSGLTARVGIFESAVAPAFDATAAYAIGDVVTYGDEIYKFTAAHAAGAWTGSDVTAVSVADEINALKSTEATTDAKIDTVANNFADEFDATESYAAGDVVMKDGVMYKFNTAHAAGAWTGTDADAIQATDLEPEPLTSAQIAALEALL